MSILKALREADSLPKLSSILGFKARSLAYIIYKIPPESKYRTFLIQKKGGGTRIISAPCPQLKLLQRRLATLLQNCIEEINAFNGLEDKISHGFKPGRSIISNAKRHRGKRNVFNADIHDFFGSINYGRVRGFFLSDHSFALTPKTATLIAQIACHNNSLPQGSPSSPVISNLIGHIVDIHLVQLAARKGCIYTRYADDLTFSTNKKYFPQSIATSVGNNNNDWTAGHELIRIINKCGFSLNPKKTRMQYSDSRQEVTGLVVNRKLNTRREYRKIARAMVHRLTTQGDFYLPGHEMGHKPPEGGNHSNPSIAQLHGILGFIDSIDNLTEDPSHDTPPARPTGRRNLYKKFLLYKEFYSSDTPVIIGEGITDYIYILHAIRQRAKDYPELATANLDGTIKLNVRFFKYSRKSTGQLVGLRGGASCLATFINSYRDAIKSFHLHNAQGAVILLVDNDSGSDCIYSILKKILSRDVERDEPYIHVVSNLYVVPTPRLPGNAPSEIEHFFDLSVRSRTIGGKSLSTAKKLDPSLHYGKVVFAHKVIQPEADSIDFSMFDPILTRIADAVARHRSSFDVPKG